MGGHRALGRPRSCFEDALPDETEEPDTGRAGGLGWEAAGPSEEGGPWAVTVGPVPLHGTPDRRHGCTSVRSDRGLPDPNLVGPKPLGTTPRCVAIFMISVTAP